MPDEHWWLINEVERRRDAAIEAGTHTKRVVQPERYVIDHEPVGHFDIDRKAPMVGAFYRHYKGGLYEVRAIATMEGSKQLYVVYRGSDGHVWVRPLAQWFETVTPMPGVTQQRFAFEHQSQAVSGSTQST